MRRFLFASMFFWLTTSLVLAQQVESPPDASPAVVEIQLTLVEWIGEEQASPETFNGSSEQIIERVAGLEKDGKLRVVQRYRLTTVDRHAVMTQRGESRPRYVNPAAVPAAAAQRAGGVPGGTRTALEHIGTLMEIKPTIYSSGSILLDISFESSNLVTRKDSPVIAEPTEGEKVRAPSITTLLLKTTLRLRDGESKVVVGAADQSERLLMVVGTKVTK